MDSLRIALCAVWTLWAKFILVRSQIAEQFIEPPFQVDLFEFRVQSL